MSPKQTTLASDITHPIADTGSTVFPRLQGVYERDEDTRTGVADSVTEGDRTTIHCVNYCASSDNCGDVPEGVDLRRVNTELLLGDTNNNGERLVNLEVRDVVELETGALNSGWERKRRCLREVNGVDTSISICCDWRSVQV